MSIEKQENEKLRLENVRLKRRLEETPKKSSMKHSETPRYQVQKSKPIPRSYSQEIRKIKVKSTMPKRTQSTTNSRNSSPFKRFDPTAYVQERNAKMTERRNRRYPIIFLTMILSLFKSIG